MEKNKLECMCKQLNRPRLISAFVICFVLSFMLYFYEPITMYLNNSNDFWFNLGIIIVPIIGITLILFFVLSLLCFFIYLISVKIVKKALIFDIYLISLFIGFICIYIQGNFLANNLPPLDGTSIDWHSKIYLSQNIISILLFVVTTIISIIFVIKMKIEKMINIIKYVALSVLVMLIVSLIVIATTNKEINKKENSIIVTGNNINDASINKNFFIFVVDATDSITFYEEMNKDTVFKEMFNDFTYFKDTMSVYPFTRDSIPLILSGTINENETDFTTYSTTAFNNSRFLEKLSNEEYKINIYEADLTWNDENAYKINNIYKYKGNKESGKIDSFIYFKEQTKYVLFKYLPFPLKKYSHIEKMDFSRANKNLYYSDNIKNYERIKKNEVNKINDNYFQFLHIDGSHVPFDLDKNVSKIENGTYRQKVQATLTIIYEYIKRLKDNDIFDNSVVIIMADHGYAGENIIGRQNPILFIKGVDEHHEIIESDIPVYQVDLVDEFINLADGKKSTELFENVDYNRERRFLFYEYTKEDHMIEFIQKGKAWDEDTLIQTGVEFNR